MSFRTRRILYSAVPFVTGFTVTLLGYHLGWW